MVLLPCQTLAWAQMLALTSSRMWIIFIWKASWQCENTRRCGDKLHLLGSAWTTQVAYLCTFEADSLCERSMDFIFWQNPSIACLGLNIINRWSWCTSPWSSCISLPLARTLSSQLILWLGWHWFAGFWCRILGVVQNKLCGLLDSHWFHLFLFCLINDCAWGWGLQHRGRSFQNNVPDAYRQ